LSKEVIEEFVKRLQGEGKRNKEKGGENYLFPFPFFLFEI
jgi:hypothetical protein